MRSDLHKELQDKAQYYLLSKGYWICGLEVPMPLGVCDAWGMSRANRLDTMAIEVKISKADFRSRSQRYKEMHPTPLGNYQYILCPAGIVLPNEIHEQWGLLWWHNGKIFNKKKAPRLEMTAEQKLNVLLYFLNNGVNVKRPLLISEQSILNV